jgi:hypothetical protein
MTRAHFDAQIGRLIVLKGWPDSVEEYFPALNDVPDQVFSRACDHALKTRTWFPVPAELRADCDVVRPRTQAANPAPSYRDLQTATTMEIANPFGGPAITVKVVRDWRHDCETCSDTGWASRFCGPTDDAKDGQQVGRCGLKHEHRSHEWVETCSCLDWNPTIRRRKEAAMSYSQPDIVRTR